jgi:hypothetical protein
VNVMPSTSLMAHKARALLAVVAVFGQSPKLRAQTPDTSVFAGQTVRLAFVDGRNERINSEELRTEIFSWISEAFPRAVVKEIDALRFGETPEGAISLSVTVVCSGAMFKSPRWVGITTIGMSFEDNRSSKAKRASARMTARGEAKLNTHGNRTAREVQGTSVPAVASGVVKVLRSVGTAPPEMQLSDVIAGARRDDTGACVQDQVR